MDLRVKMEQLVEQHNNIMQRAQQLQADAESAKEMAIKIRGKVELLQEMLLAQEPGQDDETESET